MAEVRGYEILQCTPYILQWILQWMTPEPNDCNCIDISLKWFRQWITSKTFWQYKAIEKPELNKYSRGHIFQQDETLPYWQSLLINFSMKKGYPWLCVLLVTLLSNLIFHHIVFLWVMLNILYLCHHCHSHGRNLKLHFIAMEFVISDLLDCVWKKLAVFSMMLVPPREVI